MPAKRMQILLILAVGLAALLWLDNNGHDEPGERGSNDGLVIDRSAVIDDGTGHETEMARAEQGVSMQSGNPLATVDIEELSHTVDRPLFAPSRRRPPPPIVHAPKPVERPPAVKPEPPSFVLLGVLATEGGAIALLQDKKSGRNFRVQAGDMLSGWRVSAVEPKSVLLEYRDGRLEAVRVYKP